MTEHDDTQNDGSGDGGRVETIHRWDAGGNYGSPAESVIEAVAAVTGTDPRRLTPLYDVIDPEALDALFLADDSQPRESIGGTVTFQFEGCEVTVHADGRTVVASDPDSPA